MFTSSIHVGCCLFQALNLRSWSDGRIYLLCTWSEKFYHHITFSIKWGTLAKRWSKSISFLYKNESSTWCYCLGIHVKLISFSWCFSLSENNFVRLFNADQGRKNSMSEITDLDVILTVIEEEALEIRWLQGNYFSTKWEWNLTLKNKTKQNKTTLGVHVLMYIGRMP